MRPLLIYFCCVTAACAQSPVELHVGPDQLFQNLADVPWDQLGPGDVVAVHHRPEPYREKVLISASGTAESPIRIVGVPGPDGELPIISGQGATSAQSKSYPHYTVEVRGLLTITMRRGQRWGYKPSHLVIEGLEFRGAYQEYAFTDSAGNVLNYSHNAAAVYVERGVDITVRGCVLTDSGNGLFVASGDDEAVVSRNIYVDSCELHGNGVVGKGADRMHNAYTEADGIMYDGCSFGPLRDGSAGALLKDRSTGTVVMNSLFVGGAVALDLVDPEESSGALEASATPPETLVRNNTFVNLQAPGHGSTLVHFGGDTYLFDNYRKGPLRFEYNTVYIEKNQEGPYKSWRFALFRLDTNDQRVEAVGNIFHRVGTCELSLLQVYGQARLGRNWISPGWKPFRSGLEPRGTVEGAENMITNSQNRPGDDAADLGATSD